MTFDDKGSGSHKPELWVTQRHTAQLRSQQRPFSRNTWDLTWVGGGRVGQLFVCCTSGSKCMYRDQKGTNWILKRSGLTWVLEEYLLDCGGVEVLVPVVPLPPSEAQVSAGHLEVGLGPVPRVCAHWPPLALHKHLQVFWWELKPESEFYLRWFVIRRERGGSCPV